MRTRSAVGGRATVTRAVHQTAEAQARRPPAMPSQGTAHRSQPAGAAAAAAAAKAISATSAAKATSLGSEVLAVRRKDVSWDPGWLRRAAANAPPARLGQQ